MSQTVWIVNQYASTPSTGMGGRHFYLARELAKRGNKVYLIAESNHHLQRNPPSVNGSFKFEVVDGFTVVWVKLPAYSNPHGFQRVVNWFLFTWRIRKLASIIHDKPDVILCSSPSLVSFFGAKYLADRFNVRLVFEVRDIWPLTLTEIGGYSKCHPAIRFMQWVEDKAYRDSERVISNLQNAVEHMVGRGLDRAKFHWLPNGFSLEEAEANVILDERIKNLLPKGKFIVGYTGTFGLSNALHTLIVAAERLRQYEDIVFVLVGDGKYKPVLERTVREKSLTNVVLIEPIPKRQVHAVLREFDVCFIGWLDNPLYQFGIGANKIPEYLYAAKPIVHSYSGSCDPVEQFGAGIQVPAQNPEAIVEAVLKLAALPAGARKLMGQRGRKAALEGYEYASLANMLERILFH